jgi:hypothetical protein
VSPLIQGLIIYATVIAVATPAYYAFFRWWETVPGWAVMTMATALAMVFIIIFAAVVLEAPLPIWVRGGIYAVIAVAMTVKLGAMIYVNQRGDFLVRRRRDSQAAAQENDEIGAETR